MVSMEFVRRMGSGRVLRDIELVFFYLWNDRLGEIIIFKILGLDLRFDFW